MVADVSYTRRLVAPPASLIPTSSQLDCRLLALRRLTQKDLMKVNDSLRRLLADADFVSRFYDPLTKYLSKECKMPSLLARSASELEAVERIVKQKEEIRFSSVEDLKDTACSLHQRMMPDGGLIRQNDVATISDDYGQVVRYPSACYIDEGFEDLAEILENLGPHAHVAKAITLLVNFQALHPFADGNGRVARALFNMMLHNSQKSTCYLPIYEVSQLSGGFALLSLRRAQVSNIWGPFVEFLSACADAVIRLQSEQS